MSGGGDKIIKLWGYDDGMCYYNGEGHSGQIVKVFALLSLLLVRTKSLLLVSAPKELFSFGKRLKKCKAGTNRFPSKPKKCHRARHPKSQKPDLIYTIIDLN